MPVLIIGWSVYDKLPEEEQKEFALVERYRTDYFYECYEYENAKGNKNYEWSDRCFKNQEELLEFFGYEMIEDLNADAVYARRVETFSDQDAKKLMKFSDAGNQIKVIRSCASYFISKNSSCHEVSSHLVLMLSLHIF